MDSLFIAILIGSLVLLGAGLLVRSSGSRHILNVVNYAKIGDVEQLHRWAGRCLIFGAMETGLLAIAAFAVPSYAGLFFAFFCITVIGVAMSIALGSRKFHRASSV